MEKLKLSPEQMVIFQKAITDAYQAGGQDSTFLFNGMHELIQGGEKALKKITENYTEYVMEKKFRIHISEIRIGEIYKHLPSDEEKIFESEDDLSFDALNPDNYVAWTDNLDGRKQWND